MPGICSSSCRRFAVVSPPLVLWWLLVCSGVRGENLVADAVVANGVVLEFVFPEPPPPPVPEPVPSPPEVFLPGEVSAQIEPPEAVADGARWSVDDGPELSSGEIEFGVRPGTVVVSFSDLPAWREPDPLDVLVIGGNKADVSATFTPVPVFYFRGVPEHHARHGKTLEFFVHTDDPEDPESPGPGATLVMSADPEPLGTLLFDGATGHLKYRPDADDRLPFTVRFAVTGSGGTVEAVSIITPLPILAAEARVIQTARALPDEESRDHVLITETKNPEREFNDALRETRSVDISGKVLVFDETHPAKLHEAYSERDDIEEFRLYADRVVIRSPLVLRQTHVTIYARDLRFEGEGRIDTSPKNRALVPDPLAPDGTRADDGDAGHDGGDVDVLVETFFAEPDRRRFILLGGDGGDPAAGRDGRQGHVEFPHCSSNASITVVYSEFTPLDGDTVICGARGVPVGEDAVAAGVPGDAGSGGVLRSTLDLSAFVDSNPGVAGAPGQDYVGARLQGRFVYSFVTEKKGAGFGAPSTFDSMTENLATSPGKDASAPRGRAGEQGAFELVEDSGAWLHPFALRQIVLFAKDAYLDGHVDEARDLLAEYRDIQIALAPEIPDDAELTEEEFNELIHLEQLRLEMETLIHRAESNLDYFGNPAGWVPMLSFEANLVAFENEVDASIPILYLTHWLTQAAQNVEDSRAAAIDTQVQLERELEEMENAFNEAQLAIPGLRLKAEQIAERVTQMTFAVERREQELLERARNNVEDKNKVATWRKALGVIAVASRFVPYGQPVVGAVGAGLGVLAKIDFDDPVASAKKALPKEPFSIFSQKDIHVCVDAIKAVKDGDDKKDDKDDKTDDKKDDKKKGKQDRLKRVTECGKFLGAQLKELADVFKSVQVDKKDIEAELEKIRAADVVFNDLVSELKQLLIDKEIFAQELAATIQAVSTLSSSMADNVLATHAVEEAIAEELRVLDHNALLHIKEMEQRAKDRLRSYQYFLSRAFQYRRLEPYTGTLRLDRLFDHFQELIEVGHSHTLTAEDFDTLKLLYVDELREIVFQMFDNFNAPERSLPISFRLSDDELRALNDAGRVTIDLRARGVFGSNEENIRIADLRTASMQVSSVGGEFGATALLRLNYEHSGISHITSGGDTHLFRHYRSDGVNPIVWNTVFDGLTGVATNSKLSPAAQSLIARLLDLEPSTDSGLLVFSRPGAFTDILITKEVATDNGVNMVVDDLRIGLEYHFYNTSARLAELEVATSDGLAPTIVVGRSDANGRGDGQGAFRRTFIRGDFVTLQAPESYGRYVFDRWLINGAAPSDGGAGVEFSAEIVVEIVGATRAEAVFRLAVPDDLPDEEPQVPEFVRGDTNLDGNVDLSDGVKTLEFLFLGGAPVACLDAADANDSGDVNIADASGVFNFLFLGAAPPPEPGPATCGADPTGDTLSCDRSFCTD